MFNSYCKSMVNFPLQQLPAIQQDAMAKAKDSGVPWIHGTLFNRDILIYFEVVKFARETSSLPKKLRQSSQRTTSTTSTASTHIRISGVGSTYLGCSVGRYQGFWGWRRGVDSLGKKWKGSRISSTLRRSSYSATVLCTVCIYDMNDMYR